MIQKWAEAINQDTKIFWESKGSPKGGFATFYSPVKPNPKFLIIGYNPGGGENDFTGKFQIPDVHDYFADGYDYKLAKNMKVIFSEAGMENDLQESVKTNLIFFRSRKAGDIKDKDVISFSLNKTKEIVEKLQPEYIIAEGFATFDTLLKTISGRKEQDIHSIGPKSICLATVGHTDSGIKVIGFRHPSGSRPNLSEELLSEMGKILKQLTGADD